jgi:hypothetical protein
VFIQTLKPARRFTVFGSGAKMAALSWRQNYQRLNNRLHFRSAYVNSYVNNLLIATAQVNSGSHPKGRFP